MKIQKATVEQARALAEIHITAWQIAYADILSPELLGSVSVDDREARFRDSLANNKEDTFSAEVDGEIVGFMTLGPNRDPDLTKDIGEIWGIYIAPKHWRRGYGKTMFNWAFAEMRERGFSTLVLWAFENNRRGDAFYTQMGFAKDGSQKLIPKFGAQKIVRYRREIR